MEVSSSVQTNKATPTVSSDVEYHQSLGAEDRSNAIATAAYYKAEARGFLPDHALEDWLAAEAEVNS